MLRRGQKLVTIEAGVSLTLRQGEDGTLQAGWASITGQPLTASDGVLVGVKAFVLPPASPIACPRLWLPASILLLRVYLFYGGDAGLPRLLLAVRLLLDNSNVRAWLLDKLDDRPDGMAAATSENYAVFLRRLHRLRFEALKTLGVPTEGFEPIPAPKVTDRQVSSFVAGVSLSLTRVAAELQDYVQNLHQAQASSPLLLWSAPPAGRSPADLPAEWRIAVVEAMFCALYVSSLRPLPPRWVPLGSFWC